MYLFYLITLQVYNWTHFSKLHTNHSPPGYSIQVADEYGLVPEDYIHDLKQLSDVRYIQGALFPILSFSKQRLRPFQVIVATSTVDDVIRVIPQQVRLSICKNDSTYLLGPAPSQACFQFKHEILVDHCHWHMNTQPESISLSPYAVG